MKPCFVIALCASLAICMGVRAQTSAAPPSVRVITPPLTGIERPAATPAPLPDAAGTVRVIPPPLTHIEGPAATSVPLPDASGTVPVIATPPTHIDGPAATGSWKVLGGGSFYYLQPFYQNNVAFGVTSSTTNAAGTVATGTSPTTEFDWNMQPAFAFWLGAAGPDGFGFRSRYFHLDGNSSTASVDVTSQQYNSPSAPIIAVTPSPFLFNTPAGNVPQQNPGLAGLFGGPSPFIVNFPGAPSSVDHFAFTSDLRINAVDVECTAEWKCTCLSLVGGLGGRYLDFAQHYNGFLTNSAAGATLTETLQHSHSFQGGGPTISGQMNWRPFAANLSLFSSARGSLVVGRTNQETRGSRIINDPAGAFNPIGAPTMTANSFRVPFSNDDTVPVAELELGLEYASALKQSEVFVRGAVVDQTYFGVGNASKQDGNLSLLGFQVSLEINY